MKRLEISRAAERDLAGIYAYTTRTWGGPQAEAYLIGLEDACLRLVRGSATPTRLGFRSEPLFKLRQGRHLIVFRDSETILILRVLHETMDLPAHLGE